MASVTSTAGDAALTVSPATLTNGAFGLARPVSVTPEKTAWSGPVSHDQFTIAFSVVARQLPPRVRAMLAELFVD